MVISLLALVHENMAQVNAKHNYETFIAQTNRKNKAKWAAVEDGNFLALFGARKHGTSKCQTINK